MHYSHHSLSASGNEAFIHRSDYAIDFLKEGSRMRAFLVAVLRNKGGATAIEYGLIVALIAVAAVNVMGTVGKNLSTTFNTVATKL